MKKTFKTKTILLLLGVILISLNIIGLFIPLRNSEIYSEKQTYFNDDIIFTEAQLLDKLKRTDESNETFISNTNNAIFDGIAHYWKEEGINKYNIRIPIYENYILFFASYLYPTKFKTYEFSNYHRAIERGVGLCSQHAIILSEVLEKNGINTKIVDLSCHVVVTAQLNKDNNTWWVVDPDFGVTMKNSIDEIEKSPEIIKTYYSEKGYDTSTINTLANCYNNVKVIYENAFNYSGWKRFYIEKASYIAIWVIPLLMILASLRLYLKK